MYSPSPDHGVRFRYVVSGWRLPKEEEGNGKNRLLARTFASSLIGRVRKDTEVAPSLSPGETHGTQRLGRSISDGGHPSPSPSIPLRDTWAFGGGTHSVLIHTEACAHAYACTRMHSRTSVYDVRKRRHKGKEREEEREREASRAPWEPRKMFPAYHPPLALFAPTLTLSFFLSRSFRHQWCARAHTRQTRIRFERVSTRAHREERYASENKRKTTWLARNFHRRERLVSGLASLAAPPRRSALPRNPPRRSCFLLYLFERRSCSRGRYSQLRRRLLRRERDLRTVPLPYSMRTAPRRIVSVALLSRERLCAQHARLLARTWHVGRRQWTS